MQAAQGVSTPSTSSKVAELVARMPRPVQKTQWEGVLSDVDDKAVRGAVEELYRGGRESVVGLVGMLVEPRVEERGEGRREGVAGGEGSDAGPPRTDSQARHALHALVTCACGRGEESRRAVSEALASTLDGPRPQDARAFVARQLVLCGGPEAAPALGKLLADEMLYADAAMALEKVGGSAAAKQFRAALADPNAAQRPARQRAAAVKGLGVLRDAQSVEVLRKAAADAEAEVRLAALWALARVGDVGSIDLLTRAADGAEGFERFRATDACLLLAEVLADAGRKDDAARVYRHLHTTRTTPEEKYLRDMAEARLRGE
jgi:hypothetical protein